MRKAAIITVGILICAGALASAPTASVAENDTPATVSMAFEVHEASGTKPSIVTPKKSPSAVRKEIRQKTLAWVNARAKKNTPVLASAAPVFVQVPVAQKKILAVVDQPGIEERHKKIASDVLNALPERCRGTLKNFYVRYDNPENRGLGGKSTIILSGNVPDEEFRALMVHELGHVFDLGCIQGTASAGSSEFRDGKDIIWNDDPSLEYYRISWVDNATKKKDVSAQDFVSGYASWDPFEDFAEGHAYFVLHQDLFEERAKKNPSVAKKLAWFKKHMYPNGSTIASTKSTVTADVPWDITRLPYAWHAATLLVAN